MIRDLPSGLRAEIHRHLTSVVVSHDCGCVHILGTEWALCGEHRAKYDAWPQPRPTRSEAEAEEAGEHRVTRNRAKCARCEEVIESRSVHDFVPCACGSIFVDGGLSYLRRGGNPEDILEMSEGEWRPG